MYVIVKTDNRYRGAEAVMMIYGSWPSEERALEVVRELRAELPSEYASHDEYPVNYQVRRVAMYVAEPCGFLSVEWDGGAS